MKSLLYTLFIFFISTFTLQSQTVFVDANASGSNDGTSWANAYTSLDAALDAGVTGQIWIAGGTYTPGGMTADTSSMFFVDSDVDIYGGFEGTETSIDQRTGNSETILSGDIMGNDDGNMDPTLREDNTRHVVFINSGIGSSVTLDGLSIEGGQTLDDGDAPFLLRAGAGVYTANAVNVNNCIFRGNFGRSGGGMCIDNSDTTIVDQVVITNTTFSNNVATSQSAGVVMYEVADAIIDNCTFTSNTTNRGTLYPVDCGNVHISNCEFTLNENQSGFGGAMFVWQTMHLTIENCDFIDNTSFQAAGMYYDAREIAFNNPSLTIRDCLYQDNRASGGFGGAFTLWQGTNIMIDACEFTRNTANNAGAFTYNGTESPKMNEENLIVKNCEFSSNQAVDFGGGSCYFTGSSFTIDSCTYLGNIGSSGGAIFSTGDNRSYTIKNTFFGLNAGNFGGAMTAYGDTTNANIINCEFLNNMADSGGGSMNCGFKANVYIDDCSFRGGLAAVGGAVSIQNDSTTVSINNSIITGNEATNSGGGVFSYTGSNVNLSMYNCTVSENVTNFGGGIHLGAGDDIDTSYFSLKRLIISDNTARTQGGGININNKDGVIENCLIYNNFAESVGTGGAISHNASDSLSFELDINNCTITQNLGVLSNGIAAWTDSTGSSMITLRNTLLHNGNDYEVEDGEPTIVSAGGNFSTDIFMDVILDLDDILGLDPLFVDASNIDFHLQESSPCVNAGVSEGSPNEDLDGLERDEMPDIGAYEYGGMVSTNNVSLYESLSISPNPVEDWIRLDALELNNNSRLKIYNMQGQEMMDTRISNQSRSINVKSMPAGSYLMLISGDRYYKATFIKM